MTMSDELKEKLSNLIQQFKEQNKADEDVAGTPEEASVEPSDGAEHEPDKVQQDEGADAFKEENQAEEEVADHAKVDSSADDAGVGTPVEDASASQDVEERKYAEQEDDSEASDEEEKEEDMSERFKEMEDDMGSVVEILEELKARIDNIEARLNKEESEEEVEEPMPPVVEKLTLYKGIAKEDAKKQQFVEAVNKLSFRKL